MSLSTYAQRYSTDDNQSAGGFAFDTISSNDYAISKLAFGAIGSVTYVSSSDPLPVTVNGVATAANQSTANTALSAIQSAVELLDDAISGTEMQVDVLTLPALAAGSNTIGGVNLAQYTPASGRLPVDGSGVTQPVSAANLPLPSGAATLSEQESQTASLSRVAGKYVDFDTGGGSDSVVALGLLLPGNGGSVIGGTQSNPIRTDPTGSTTQPVSGTVTVNAGSGTFVVGDGGSSITVDGTVAISGTVTVDTHAVTATNLDIRDLSQAADSVRVYANTAKDGNGTAYVPLVDTDGHLQVDVLSLPSLTVTANAGTNLNTSALALEAGGNLAAAAGSLNTIDDWDESDRAKVNIIVGQAGVAAGNGGVSTTTQRVCLATDVALPAGTNNIGDVDILTIAAGDNNIGNVDIVTMPNVTLASGTNTNEVVGDAAHDAAIAGNPVRIAGRALASDYTAVTAGDTADLITTLLGKLVTIDYANPAHTWSYAAASGGITDTSGVTAKAAAGSGVRNYVTKCQVVNGHATVSTDVQIRDGAAGTVLWRGFAQAVGGGIEAEFKPPLRGSANTLIEVACGTTGSATYFNLQGYTAAE